MEKTKMDENMIVKEVAEKEEKFSKEETGSRTDDQLKEETEAEEEEEVGVKYDQQQGAKGENVKVLSFEDWFHSFADYRLDQGMIESPLVETSDVEEGATVVEDFNENEYKVENEDLNDFLAGVTSLPIVEEQITVEDGKEDEERDKTGKDDIVNISIKSVTDGEKEDKDCTVESSKGEDTIGGKKRKREEDDKGARPRKFLKTEFNFSSEAVPIIDQDISNHKKTAEKEENVEEMEEEETEDEMEKNEEEGEKNFFKKEEEKGEEKEKKEEEKGWRSHKKLRAWTGRVGSMISSWMNRLL